MGRREVANDEEFLARLDQAELAAGQILDGGGVFTQTARLLTQPHVLGATPRQRLLECAVFLALLEHLHQPLVAHERVDEKDASGEDERVLNELPASAPLRRAAEVLCLGYASHVSSCENTAFRRRVHAEFNGFPPARTRFSVSSSASTPTPSDDRDTPADAIRLVLTTLGGDADAFALARTLVNERLAACVNVLPPMTSIYRWKGAVEQDREQLLIMKTSPDRLAALEARLHRLHPYELPEFVVLDAAASAAYAGWVRECASDRSRT